MKKTVGTILLSAFLFAPVSLLADDHARHQWNDSENTYWHQYLKEHHRKDHDWDKASARERSQYWKWRDAHHEDHH